MKILACSDPLMINSSYSLQMRLLINNLDAGWHYVQNGVRVGQKEEIRDENGEILATLYPGESKSASYSPDKVFKMANELDPDVVFLYEDPQHLYKYMTFQRKTPHAAICWFPWDNDEWNGSIGAFLTSCEDSDYVPIGISRATQKLCHDNGHDIGQIYNIVDDVFRPLDPTLVNAEKASLLRQFELPRDRKILLYVGRLAPRKNIESLLSMAQSLRRKREDFVLFMHCDINDPGSSCDLRTEIITRGMVEYVRVNIIEWDKGVSSQELNMLYNCCDVYVSASGGEGFGLPVCEAGACGKTFVVPDNTTGPEFSQNGKHGLLAPNGGYYRVLDYINRPFVDHDAMAEQVDYLLDHKNLAWRMGESFRKWVQANCSVKVVMEQFKHEMEQFVPLECTVKT